MCSFYDFFCTLSEFGVMAAHAHNGRVRIWFDSMNSTTKHKQMNKGNMIDIKEVPQDVLDEIKERFESEPRVRQLRIRQQSLMRNMQYEESLELAKEIERLQDRVIYEYLEESKEQVERVEIAKMGMSDKDRESLMQMFLVCFMCADVIETAVMNIDDLLHKYDKDLCAEMFNDIRDVMKMSKKKLSFLKQNSGYMKDLIWAERCDDLYDMAKSKAGVIMRKANKNQNCGMNTKK